MIIHFLKTTPNHFNETLNGKDFEIRFNDRDFKINDFVVLQEFKRIICPTHRIEQYTGREIVGKITASYNINDITEDQRFDNYVAFKLKIIKKRNC